MTHRLRRYMPLAATVAVTVASGAAMAQAFVPPGGYSTGAPNPRGRAAPPLPGSPSLTPIDPSTLASRFVVDASYGKPPASPERISGAEGRRATVKLVGAFWVGDTARARLIDAWAPGYLPVTLAFADGRCRELTAGYENGRLSDGRLTPTSCERRAGYQWPPAPTPPSGTGLRRIAAAWGFEAFADDRTATTIVSAPHTKTFTPLFTARMTTVAMAAMNSPDASLADITLVGRIDGRSVVAVVEVSY